MSGDNDTPAEDLVRLPPLVVPRTANMIKGVPQLPPRRHNSRAWCDIAGYVMTLAFSGRATLAVFVASDKGLPIACPSGIRPSPLFFCWKYAPECWQIILCQFGHFVVGKYLNEQEEDMCWRSAAGARRCHYWGSQSREPAHLVKRSSQTAACPTPHVPVGTSYPQVLTLTCPPDLLWLSWLST